MKCRIRKNKGHHARMNRLISSLGSGLLLLGFCMSILWAATPLILLSQIPLQLATPSLPQVLIALGNSESMDGSLSGAIMVGSGILPTSLTSLYNSSSPVNYTVPTGFNPPVQAANGSGLAPYTVSQNGALIDNGASRLNVAKEGIQAILQNYMQNTNFALEEYSTSGAGVYTTWVYYMSPPGSNFVFTNTQLSGNRYVTNPCYNYTSASSSVKNNCTSLATLYGASTLASSQFMQIGASSDDPDSGGYPTINDVLYAGGLPGVFVSYVGPSPASPYPPNYQLSNYNNGSVSINYSKTMPNINRFSTGPTNAGYVPFSQQVMYVQRGFGYYANQSASSGNIIVPMTSSGAHPTTASVNTAISKFTPYLQPETNNPSTTEIKSLGGQAPIAGLLTTAKSYLSQVPLTGCNPKLYVVLISDGLPTKDLSGFSWPPLGSAAATGYGVTATFNPDGSLNTTNNQALKDTISIITSLSADNIKTYVIGLGAGVDPTVNPVAAQTLTAMAIAGGTTDYYAASSAQALVNDLNNILISVQNATLATSAAAISSTNLQIGSVEYQASFTSSDKTYQDWTGNLVSISLDPVTGYPTGSSIWAAQPLLDAQSSRLIATWNPSIDSGNGRGVPFQWASISATQQTELQPNDTLGANRLLYLRGNTSLEKRNGGLFRSRTHILGDIVGSQPIFVAAPLNTALYGNTSYAAFAQTNSTRQPMIYVGANDGMLHAFNASTGTEKFAFVPNGVFSNLVNLTAPLYNQNHIFYVDGSPSSADVQFSDSSWHTILVGGENSGGRSVYALDITNAPSTASEAALANSVLWEFSDVDMGYSYSVPQIGQISTTSTTNLRFAAFFGNGYDSLSNKDILYVVNPQTGALIRKFDLCAAVPGACNKLLPTGLSSVALGQSDGLQGQPISQVYVGDLQGNLWAIDVSSTNPAEWQVRLLFQAQDLVGNPQPITTTPVVTLNPSYPRFQGNFIMFGTGQLLSTSDLTNSQLQSIYGVWDKPFSSLVLGRLNLQSQTINLVTAATSGLPQSILTSTTNAIAWNNTYGWYVDLPIPGQRVITNPLLINGSFITTLNTPPATSCGVASSMFLDIYYATGGAYVNLTQLDINGSGTITSADQYNGSNPVGIALLPGYASAPASVGLNKHNNMVQIVTMSNGQQISVINTNNNVRQSGWWQIQ